MDFFIKVINNFIYPMKNPATITIAGFRVYKGAVPGAVFRKMPTQSTALRPPLFYHITKSPHHAKTLVISRPNPD